MEQFAKETMAPGEHQRLVNNTDSDDKDNKI
jgi:hypothetical protein